MVKPVVENKNANAKRCMIEPPTMLDRPLKKVLAKGDYHSYKLWQDPKDSDSAKYELIVPIYRGESGTVEELLHFLSLFNKVMYGQNCTEGPQRFALMRNLLEGSPKATFENEAAEHDQETVSTFEQCVLALKKSVSPVQVARKQKRYKCCFKSPFARKPVPLIGCQPQNKAYNPVVLEAVQASLKAMENRWRGIMLSVQKQSHYVPDESDDSNSE